jgi:polysaccharide export outer membrane protein
MIVRFLGATVLFLGLASVAFAQDPAPAPAEPAASSSNGSAAADAAPAAAPRASSAVAAEPVMVADPKEYRIGPEDVLDFHVWKNQDLSRERVPVRPDGKLSLPLVNDIQAAGLTPNELRAELTQRLSPFIQSPEVSVIVREVHSFKVSVQGNVRMPGQYEVRSEATVLDMIARAQGLTDFADKGAISVIRRSGERQQQIKFNYGDAIRAKEGANFFVLPGDIIIVG